MIKLIKFVIIYQIIFLFIVFRPRFPPFSDYIFQKREKKRINEWIIKWKIDFYQRN